MGKTPLFERIRDFIGLIAWRVFLWSIQMSDERYWNSIYEQEKALKGNN